jgi:hypothetical protein
MGETAKRRNGEGATRRSVGVRRINRFRLVGLMAHHISPISPIGPIPSPCRPFAVSPLRHSRSFPLVPDALARSLAVLSKFPYTTMGTPEVFLSYGTTFQF